MIKIWSRRSTILPQFVGLTFGVHNGQKHMPVLVSRGHGRPQVRRVRADADLLRPRAPTRRRRGSNDGQGQSASARSKDNEAQAVLRMVRISPQKLNLVAALIRGKKVATALADLEFSRKRIAGTVRKTLQSAIANAENNHDLDVDALVVAEAHVGKALVMKRFHAARPRPRRPHPEAVLAPDHRRPRSRREGEAA